MYFAPQNIQIALWGDFNEDDILELVSKYFADWGNNSVQVPPPPEVDYKFESRIHYIRKDDVNQSNI